MSSSTTAVAVAAVIITVSLLPATISGNTYAAAAPPSPPSHPSRKPPEISLIPTILFSLGFQNLSDAASPANITSGLPTTVFAIADSSLLTCPACSPPRLLQEHSLPGLYPLHFLRSLAFGTKIESLASNRCLTITSEGGATAAATPAPPTKVFVNGVEITEPDLFNNGFLIIHGLQGFISHLSPLSCNIEVMTSLSFPVQPPPTTAFLSRRRMLKDAMTHLRASGYTMVALAMRVKYSDLSNLDRMTLFAVDDLSIFGGSSGGRSYVAEVGFHILPNKLLRGTDLTGLTRGTTLGTMKEGRKLVVTSAAGGGTGAAPMRINYVKVKKFDIVHNGRIVVHGLPMPFRDLPHLVATYTNYSLLV